MEFLSLSFKRTPLFPDRRPGQPFYENYLQREKGGISRERERDRKKLFPLSSSFVCLLLLLLHLAPPPEKKQIIEVEKREFVVDSSLEKGRGKGDKEEEFGWWFPPTPLSFFSLLLGPGSITAEHG